MGKNIHEGGGVEKLQIMQCHWSIGKSSERLRLKVRAEIRPRKTLYVIEGI